MRHVKDLIDVFLRYEQDAGVVGVALGNKMPGNPKSPHAIALMVPRKLPRKGAKRKLGNGCLLLPQRLQVGRRRVLADVIEARATRAKPSQVQKQQGAQFPAGSQISNRTSTGTFGCLVRKGADPRVFVLTNRHVAIGAGNQLFVPVFVQGAVATTVHSDLDLVDDNAFLPFLTDPNAWVDVDAAIAAIPSGVLGRFAPDIPGLGRPVGSFQPDYSSREAYQDSVVGTPVASYSWNSGRRDGVISHVLYATRSRRGGAIVLYTFLIAGANGIVPGESRDSGKVWVGQTGIAGEVDIVALHQGVVRPQNADAQYGVATDFFARARLLQIAPA